ncbi:DUF1415 domain-containing protein [Simiduia curdlanivorans]|uniref:DUF1415 domain-containing protein n=1 Tax=Simiduia curdlanivorans TaxID=1492769 RepID=A0ABV8V0I5_9GAMM|nr:DUF1415 domain-containing protein [Simiduia curdlanivorans]MDN3638086.1 DUF1415 domain-containing protein [Simiduia curdlanivorans]
MNNTQSPVITATQQWLADVVIGLNLCPFARKPQRANLIRFTESRASSEQALLAELLTELEYLDATHAEQLETTLLIIPNFLQDFVDYNQFLDLADWLLERHDYEGVYQLATFHPHYQFAGTRADDAENLTNRAPYPILHLIREDSIERVLENYPDPEAIPENNIRAVQSLTPEQRKKLFPYV